MDRRYYGLKAVLVAAALMLAAYCSGMGCGRLMFAGNPNYQAAAVAGAEMQEAGLEVARSIGSLLSRPLAVL